MKNKIVALAALVGALVAGLGVGSVVAYNVDPNASFGYIYFLSGGAAAWSVGTNGTTNNYRVRDLSTDSDARNITQGIGVGIFARTTTQLLTLAPVDTGKLVYNSSVKAVCISSGPAAGAWVFLSTSATTSGNNATSCTSGQ